jgi:protocatechuate 3,4-dioxygenase beta subunit
MNPSTESSGLSRRHLIRNAGALGVGATMLGRDLTAAMHSSGPSSPYAPPGLAAAVARSGGPPEVLTHVCVQTPAMTEGPYYLPNQLLRRDITEGKPGLAMRAFFLVVRASDCSPVANAVVDLWHADAMGLYSGFNGGSGTTFLRGIQRTDANGLVWFDTIFPGYYPGRTWHTHLKVRPTATTELTTQTFADDGLVDVGFRLFAPYNTRATRATRNTNDNIYDARNLMTFVPNPDGSASVWAGLVIGVA